MGAWGNGLFQNDMAADITDEFKDRLKNGDNIETATKHILTRYAGDFDNENDGLIAWLALARMQWTYGVVDIEIVQSIQKSFDSEIGFDTWKEAGEQVLSKFRKQVTKFLAKIAEPNPRPKPFPKSIICPPYFLPGDCLSIELPDGRYAAALVLAADHSNLELGMNLIATLDYLSKQPPDLDVFKQPKWLRLTHHNFDGEWDVRWYMPIHYRTVRKRIKIIGNVPILDNVSVSTTYSSYRNIAEQVVLQRDWDDRMT